ncbi:alpha/beta fold hydrolase [Enteractinococcus coprophilus]|uniref:Pimeloyl-ACP methyl ester carboxylesterase n=1 Tax=Enteractinococcus coprophilus TaxID=1027633 RepID=A0A543AMR4_9MICC|nr:alpha/beta hydrolase [Enteractinococcus coprophilus]TQL73870.1 pimeloyl-ACP methyl ester carboxylesterase [Enteractinococcus coprophilus]
MTQETPTLVFLHGVGLDRTMWENISDQLPESAVYLDLPGHGHQPVLREPTSLQTLADDIAARLPSGPIQLVGFSLGGLIAQRLAIDLPEKIVSVVAANSVCKRTTQERAAVLGRLATARADFLESTQRSIERWYPAGVNVPTELIQQTQAVLANNDRRSFLYAYEVFATADADLADDLVKLHQPLLAMTGELDPGSTPEMSQRLADLVPDGKIHIFSGARHMVPHEQPHEFIAQLEQHFALEEADDR